MCIEMWSLVRSHVDRDTYRRMKPKTLFFWYSLWCWGPSVILILVSMIMDLSPTIPATYVKPNFGKDSCQFKCKSNKTFNSMSSGYFYHFLLMCLVWPSRYSRRFLSRIFLTSMSPAFHLPKFIIILSSFHNFQRATNQCHTSTCRSDCCF